MLSVNSRALIQFSYRAKTKTAAEDCSRAAEVMICAYDYASATRASGIVKILCSAQGHDGIFMQDGGEVVKGEIWYNRARRNHGSKKCKS